MKTTAKYCQNKFQKSLVKVKGNEAIHKHFELLALEIQKLDPLTQINLYSATTQFLNSLVHEPNELMNALDLFSVQCNSILDHKYDLKHKITLGLAVVAISLATLIVGASVGIGIGVLASLWATPLVFMNLLMAANGSAVGVTAAVGALSLAATGISSLFFFKTPKIKTQLAECIESVKETQMGIEKENTAESEDAEKSQTVTKQ